MNLQESIRRILREESRFDKMGEERYKSCSMSDITRMEIIDDFLKEVETNSKYNKEEPNYDMLLDDWDGYDDQVYIQNQLDDGRIIFYEGWVDSCWSAVYKKPQYEGMDEEEVIDSIITKRFPRIAEEFNMVIDDYGYFNNGDGYIMYIVLKESNTNLQETIRRILREEIEIPLYIRRRYACIDEYITKLENGEETIPIRRQLDWINYQLILTAFIRNNCGDENQYYDPRIHSKIMDVFGKRLHKWYKENINL